MAEKIDVWAHKHSHRGEWFVDEKPHETKIGGTQKPCTLVVHDNGRERVFTESEVVALVRDIMNDQTSADIANGYVNVVIGWADILRKHGVPFLDPA